jgi:hypothetical protein
LLRRPIPAPPTRVTAEKGSIITFIENYVAPTIMLTVGIDTDTTAANNVTFYAPGVNAATQAPANTLNTGDTLTDTGTGGVLDATFGVGAGSISPIQATISGISTYNLTNSAQVPGLVVPVILNGASLTGVTTIDDIGSQSDTDISVGTPESPLATAVATFGISSAVATTLTVYETVAALAGAADAIVVNALNVGSPLNPVVVSVGDGVTNGVENWTVNSASTNPGGNFLTLGTIFGTSATSLTVTVNGTGPIQLTANPSSFENVTSIVATGASAGVMITGLSSAGVNDNGLLSNNTALTSATFGAGNDSIDVSNMNPTEVTALTATGGAGTNTIILSDAMS